LKAAPIAGRTRTFSLPWVEHRTSDVIATPPTADTSSGVPCQTSAAPMPSRRLQGIPAHAQAAECAFFVLGADRAVKGSGGGLSGKPGTFGNLRGPAGPKECRLEPGLQKDGPRSRLSPVFGQTNDRPLAARGFSHNA
jgi:hypothetical protein